MKFIKRIIFLFFSYFKKEKCDICHEDFKASKLLYDENYKICGLCSDIQSELSSEV